MQVWTNDCIVLSNHFLQMSQFAQAEYLLLTALSILPEREDQEIQSRMLVNLALGQFY